MSHIGDYLAETGWISATLSAGQIERMVDDLVALRSRGGRLFMIGLGGSAANCSHAVNDFRKLCGIEAYTPVDNVSELTARANDEGWQHIFRDWLDGANLNEKDAIFVLSVGGGKDNVSRPVYEAVDKAVSRDASIYAVVGRDGGHTAMYATNCIIVPTVNDSRVTPHTEGWQSVILHAIVSHPDLQIRKTKW